KEMYTGFLAVFYEGTAPLSGNEVVATMVYNFRDGTRRLIEFLPGAQAGFYAVRIDGEVRWPFVVGSYQLARLLSAMQRLVN
ncbi:MAG: hypothetical protein FWE37_09510, partial [Spirochaetaceae bacterium]|nr:hypothetical protein [Spirochaetaceae bacterium]